jgi:addiction module HigA family antidote
MTPGDLLRQLRTEKQWTQTDAGYVLNKPIQWVSQVENGKKAITAEMALKLEAAFNVSARTWLQMQNEVDLERARKILNIHRQANHE